MERLITFQQRDLTEVEAPTGSDGLHSNMPYGDRLGADTDLGASYKLLGNVLKQRFKGWTAYVLSGNKALSSNIGLKSASLTPVYNGASIRGDFAAQLSAGKSAGGSARFCRIFTAEAA